MILVFSEGDVEDQDVGGVSFSYVKTMRQFFLFFCYWEKEKEIYQQSKSIKVHIREVKFTRLKKVRNKLLCSMN